LSIGVILVSFKKRYTKHRMIRPQHVDKGRLNKRILKTSVDNSNLLDRLYFEYIVNIIDLHKSLTTSSQSFIELTSPRAVIEMKMSRVIDTDSIGRCISRYYMIVNTQSFFMFRCKKKELPNVNRLGDYICVCLTRVD
jgi:hypothetical protein